MEKLNLSPYAKGQVWMIEEDFDMSKRKMGLTVHNRPVVIMNSLSSVGDYVTVIPFSSSSITNKNGVKLWLEETKQSIALICEIRPMAVKALNQYLGNLSADSMKEIDLAVGIYLGMIPSDEDTQNKYFPILDNKRPIFTATLRAPIPAVNHAIIPALEVETEKSHAIHKGGKKKSFDIETMSSDEKFWILQHSAQEASKHLNISTTTIYKYRKMLKATYNSTSTVSIDEAKNYPACVYATYAKRPDFNFSSIEEKKIFVKLDADKLASMMNIDSAIIRKEQQIIMKSIV